MENNEKEKQGTDTNKGSTKSGDFNFVISMIIKGELESQDSSLKWLRRIYANNSSNQNFNHKFYLNSRNQTEVSADKMSINPKTHFTEIDQAENIFAGRYQGNEKMKAQK